MNFTSIRFAESEDYTYSTLYDNSLKYPDSFIIEDEGRLVKVPKETRIQSGVYEIVINKVKTPLTLKYRKRFSWFKFHLMLKDVLGFTGVYMHLGQTDEHTGGCLSMASSCDLTPPTKDGLLMESVEAFEKFYKKLYPYLNKNNNRAFIRIVDFKDGIQHIINGTESYLK